MKTVIGIPARMGSSRFPGKPLCSILGLSMIEHVYRRCSLAKRQDIIFVATCDEEIRRVVEGFGGRAIMTPAEIERPGLRVAEAVKQLSLADDDVVVVMQGDEPLVRPEMLDLGIETLLAQPQVLCTNLGAKPTEAEWLDPNEVKVVTDEHGDALFMSRSPIPSNTRDRVGPRMKQLGIMFFRKKALFEFQALAPMPLEIAESIEMLRAIEHGRKVRMVLSPYITASVDTEADRRAAEELMKKDPIWPSYAPKSAKAG